MTIPDPHRVLVDDLHAEIRRLRAELERVEAELRQALWHLNPPMSASASAAPDATVGDDGDRSQEPRSSEGSLYGSVGAANAVGRCRTIPPPGPTPHSEAESAAVSTLPDVGPVTIVPGITVSPSIIRQRTQPARDEGDDGDLDDESEGEE